MPFVRDERPISVFNVHERIRGDYAFTISDRNGVPVPASVLTAATMSLYLTSPNGVPFTYINGRQAQDILNTNNVLISEGGRIVWDIQSADMEHFDPTQFFEPRIAVFAFVWPEGVILHEVTFIVRQVPNSPLPLVL